MMPLDPRDILERVRTTVRDVHDGLLTWIDRTLSLAGLEGVQTSSDFPPDGRTAPTLVVFPYRFGPDPNLYNTSRGVGLLGLGSDYVPNATGLPEPWSQMGRLMTSAVLGVWPRDTSRPLPPTPVGPAPLDSLPEPLKSWYGSAPPAWRLDRGGVTFARLPSLWYVPGLSVTVSYLVSASAASRGVLPSDIESTPLLLSALSAVVTAIHHEAGFDLSVVPQAAEQNLPSYVNALASTVQAAQGPPDLVSTLREAADTLTRRHLIHVEVLLTQELATGELFTLMQALQRPFKAAFCLRVSLRLADALQFGPSSEITPALGRFVYEAPGSLIPSKPAGTPPPVDLPLAPQPPVTPGVDVQERRRS